MRLRFVVSKRKGGEFACALARFRRLDRIHTLPPFAFPPSLPLLLYLRPMYMCVRPSQQIDVNWYEFYVSTTRLCAYISNARRGVRTGKIYMRLLRAIARRVSHEIASRLSLTVSAIRAVRDPGNGINNFTSPVA